MQAAIEQSNAGAGNQPGGFRETGFFTAVNPVTGAHEFIPTLPGQFQRPSGSSVSIYNYDFIPDPAVFTEAFQRKIDGWAMGLHVHVHPAGWYIGGKPQEPTANADIVTASNWRGSELGIVVGAGDKTVYFYNNPAT